MRARLAASVLAGLALTTAPALALTPSPVVQTTSGPVQGFSAAGINTYVGIPYAKPPVGALRWMPPQAPVASTSTIQATTVPNFCPQGLSELTGSNAGSEDCLYINVYVPAGATAASKLPVMFWIHGGGLTTGSGAEYAGGPLAATGNVIVVNFNYRLGLLGFLANAAFAAEDTQHGSTGNYGLMDQQFAFAWMKKNIAAFGGDPTKVTVFGESAGGQSTIDALISPTMGSFSRAIIESGAYARTYPTEAEAESAGQMLATSLGCTGSATAIATCLRQVPVNTLLNAENAANNPVTIAPNIDNYVLTQQPFTAIAAGNFKRVPVIDGTNHDEYRLFVSEQDLTDELAGQKPGYTDAGYVNFVTAAQPGFASQVLAEYPVTDFPSPNYAVATVATDYAFSCGALVLDSLLSQYVPVYTYEFDDPTPVNVLLPPDPNLVLGDSHAIELVYLYPQFKNVTLNLGPAVFPAAQAQLSTEMRQVWSSFARYGRPLNPSGGAWQPYSAASHNFTALISPGQRVITSFYDDHKCGFWGPAILTEAGLPATTNY